MKPFYNHYRMRFVRMFLTSGIIFFLYIFASWNHYQGDVRYLNNITYEEMYGNIFLSRFILFVAALWILQFFLMYRDYSIAKTRLLLLPQHRCTIVLADAFFLFIMLLLLYGLCLWLYYLGFHAFIHELEKQQIINFMQTKNMWISLRRTAGLAYVYPQDILGILRILSAACLLSAFHTTLVSVLLIEQDMIKHLIKCVIICILAGLCMYVFCDGICIFVLLAMSVYLLKQSIDAWSNNLIGG